MESADRALRTLRAGNRALLLASEENALLQEMCRVIVEEGGYAMAWVGYAQHDEAKTIRPMASHGFHEGYLEVRNFTWDEHDASRSTAGRAIRDGVPCLGRKLLTDPDVLPEWRAEAQKRGYAAVSSFPLPLEGEVIGNLSIYSADPEAFTPEEAELLADLAQDLAFGIRNLRTQAARDRAREELLRLDRARRTLSAGNRTLLRAADEQSLLEGMCRAVVEVGGYRAALVNYALKDPGQTLRPMAHAGLGEGQILRGDLTWADNEQGQSTGARAIRSGAPCVARNFMTDPLPASLHEAAMRCGYAAASAFPLFVDGEVLGSLCIIAGETEAFGPAEVEVLAEMSDDLAFGIATLRAREKQRQAEETIQRLACYDRLTGLPNRVKLAMDLEQAVAEARGTHRPLALLMVGLDHFREINETLGYRQGDHLLQEIAARLIGAVGNAEAVARCGEAEFGILLPRADAGAATRLAQKIVLALYDPVESADVALDARASVGIALFPGHGAEPDVLIRRANVAMQQARRGSSGYTLYIGGKEEECARRLALISDLHRGIERDELLLYCQPKVVLQSRRVCGAEALVRWQHPRLGLIAPQEFIGLAESSGLIDPLSDWVLQAAFRQCYAWHEAGLTVPMAVNLSARDLQDPKLVERIRDMIATWGAQADWMQFELTESALMQDPKGSEKNLSRLKDLGAEIFIDDFGTGYSSLSYLQRLPVDAIKIDKSFVEEMLSSKDCEAIVRSTIDLAHDLEMEVVAEGVENRDFWDHLVTRGCDMAQGYFVSRPFPAEDFGRWQKDCPWVV